MPWEPEPRPDWIREVNSGQVLPIGLEASRPLERHALMGEAQASLGLSDVEADWGNGDFLEPLDLVLAELEANAQLTVFGRWFTRRFLLRLLTVRLQLAQYERHDPGVVDEVVEAPIFVVGAPRTGTTFTHTLLATDPALRAPEGWEFLRPVPPPQSATFEADPRIELADTELSLPQLASKKLLTIHKYRGRMLKECLSAMSFAFRSEEFISRYDVPGYVDWLQACDMTPAYAMHRRVLQVLQRRMPGTRWVLKSPVHLHNVPTLLRVYPDARLIVTHRDPLTVLASVTSLVATLRYAQSDDVDVTSVGRYHAELYTRSLDGLVDLDERGVLPKGRVAHVAYPRLVADPMAAVDQMYRSTGLEFSVAARTALQGHLDVAERSAEGPHRYDFADLGIDRAATRRGLERYAKRFDVDMQS